MKKTLWLAGFLSACLLLTGCQKFSPEVSGISINEKHMITEVIKENFENSGYNSEELSSQISKDIDAYNINAGAKCIKSDKLKIKDGVALLKINYATPRDFAVFNHVDFYVGDIVGAVMAGYPFPGKFDAVSKGQVIETGIWGSHLTSGDTSLKTVVIGEKTLVQVPGSIIFVSEGVKVTGSNEAVTETNDIAYILYE